MVWSQRSQLAAKQRHRIIQQEHNPLDNVPGNDTRDIADGALCLMTIVCLLHKLCNDMGTGSNNDSRFYVKCLTRDT